MLFTPARFVKHDQTNLTKIFSSASILSLNVFSVGLISV